MLGRIVAVGGAACGLTLLALTGAVARQPGPPPRDSTKPTVASSQPAADARSPRNASYAITARLDLAAAKARVALDGKELDGRTLRVAVAT